MVSICTRNYDCVILCLPSLLTLTSQVSLFQLRRLITGVHPLRGSTSTPTFRTFMQLNRRPREHRLAVHRTPSHEPTCCPWPRSHADPPMQEKLPVKHHHPQSPPPSGPSAALGIWEDHSSMVHHQAGAGRIRSQGSSQKRFLPAIAKDTRLAQSSSFAAVYWFLR